MRYPCPCTLLPGQPGLRDSTGEDYRLSSYHVSPRFLACMQLPRLGNQPSPKPSLPLYPTSIRPDADHDILAFDSFRLRQQKPCPDTVRIYNDRPLRQVTDLMPMFIWLL